MSTYLVDTAAQFDSFIKTGHRFAEDVLAATKARITHICQQAQLPHSPKQQDNYRVWRLRSESAPPPTTFPKRLYTFQSHVPSCHLWFRVSSAESDTSGVQVTITISIASVVNPTSTVESSTAITIDTTGKHGK
jgi:hypothetical protein